MAPLTQQTDGTSVQRPKRALLVSVTLGAWLACFGFPLAQRAFALPSASPRTLFAISAALFALCAGVAGLFAGRNAGASELARKATQQERRTSERLAQACRHVVYPLLLLWSPFLMHAPYSWFLLPGALSGAAYFAVVQFIELPAGAEARRARITPSQGGRARAYRRRLYALYWGGAAVLLIGSALTLRLQGWPDEAAGSARLVLVGTAAATLLIALAASMVALRRKAGRGRGGRVLARLFLASLLFALYVYWRIG